MDNSGFTLIEMLLSVFIISIIASFVAYNLVSEVRQSDLTNARLQIDAGLELARSCAIAGDTESEVVFETSQLTIECQNLEQTIKFDGIEISTNFPNNTAIFNPHGIVNQAATIEVCNSSGCNQLTIGVGRSYASFK